MFLSVSLAPKRMILAASISGALVTSCVFSSSEVKLSVDATAYIRPINPDIYGISTSGGARPYFKEMGVSVVRWGGNARSRFNWEINASNAGVDWEFRNLDKGDEIPGSAALDFHRRNSEFGAESLLTIPMLGWVARDKNEATRSVDVPDSEIMNGYAPQENRVATSLASFVRKSSLFQFPPDRSDNAVYQDEWVSYLAQTLGNGRM